MRKETVLPKELLKPSGRDPVRVRTFLDGCREAKQKLRHKMFDNKMPADLETTPYPSTLIKLFPEKTSSLGCVVEWMLKKKHPTWSDFKSNAMVFSSSDESAYNKAIKNKSSIRFLETIQATAKLLHESFEGYKPIHEPEIQLGDLVGHPDVIVYKPDGVHIYEIKYTGKVKTEYTNFLLQLFCYGAIKRDAVALHLVLANQQKIITWKTSDWAKRTLFTTTALKLVKQQSARMCKIPFVMQFQQLRKKHFIGYHAVRKPGMKFDTLVNSLPPTMPMQVFLMSNTSTKMNKIPDEQFASIKSEMLSIPKTMFFHAPYTINLCITPCTMDDYFTKSLSYHLQVGKNLGFQGVVVHTGRATKNKGYTIDNMIQNVWRVLPDASPECPLLIETPAHQGTETLNTPEELASFIMSFYVDNPIGTATYMRKILGVCVDTCHVFAAGYQPTEYLEDFTSLLSADVIKLIHLNDSYYPLDSHKDRHYPCGMGEIPWKELMATIDFGDKHLIPMITE